MRNEVELGLANVGLAVRRIDGPEFERIARQRPRERGVLSHPGGALDDTSGERVDQRPIIARADRRDEPVAARGSAAKRALREAPCDLNDSSRGPREVLHVGGAGAAAVRGSLPSACGHHALRTVRIGSPLRHRDRARGRKPYECRPFKDVVCVLGHARRMARALTSAKPRRFCPRHRRGSRALAWLAPRPMPQIVSRGAASTRIASPVASR